MSLEGKKKLMTFPFVGLIGKPYIGLYPFFLHGSIIIFPYIPINNHGVFFQNAHLQPRYEVLLQYTVQFCSQLIKLDKRRKSKLARFGEVGRFGETAVGDFNPITKKTFQVPKMKVRKS